MLVISRELTQLSKEFSVSLWAKEAYMYIEGAYREA